MVARTAEETGRCIGATVVCEGGRGGLTFFGLDEGPKTPEEFSFLPVVLGTDGPGHGAVVAHTALDGPPTLKPRLFSRAPVTSLDLEPLTGSLLVADCAGWIQVVGLADGKCVEPWVRPSTGPVLAARFLDTDRVVISDVRGVHCLSIQDARLRQRWPTHGAPICALRRVDDGRMVGASRDGVVHLWDAGAQRVETLAAPPPSQRVDHAGMAYDAASHCLLYHDLAGGIVAVCLDSMQWTHVEAAVGPYYAVCACGSHVLTFAAGAGELSSWDPNRGRYMLHRRFESPADIVAATGIPGSGRDLLAAVRADGSAAILELGDSLRLLHPLGNRGYRFVHGPSDADLVAWRESRRIARTAAIERQIVVCMADQPIEVEPLARELESLGFARQAKQARAEAARRLNDPITELSALRGLLAEPDVDVLRQDAIPRYCALALQLGLLRSVADALALAKKAQANGFALELAVPEGIRPALSGGEVCLIQPPEGLSIARAVAAASVLEQPLDGLRQLFPSAWALFGCARLDAGALGEKYRQIRQERDCIELPDASVQNVWWIRPAGAVRRPTVLLRNAERAPIPSLAAAVAIEPSATDTTIERAVLLDAVVPATGSDWRAHNSCIAQVAQWDDLRAAAWVQSIDRILSECLRRLRAAAAPPWQL